MAKTRVKIKKNGISTFIATLLLMVLAVSAGVVIYAYTMGYLGGFGGPQTMGAISLDTHNFADDTHLQVYVRNIGKTTFQLQSVYIDGVSVPTADFIPLTIDENEVSSTTITYTAGFGTITHVVKLIGVDNTQISFNAKGTKSTGVVTYSLTINTVGSGSVAKSPNQSSYSLGASVQLTATPLAGWVFSSWSGDLTGSTNPGTVIIDADPSVTATFVSGTANQPPVLAAIGNQSGDELTLITFDADATDPDVGDTLTFSLDPGYPSGASINSGTGVFTWTPTEAQDGDHSITVRVTDNGSPALDDYETINVHVNEVAAANQPPVLGSIGDKTVDELSLLTFDADATDPDIGDTLTFSLQGTVPPGASINSGTGVFTWTPTEAQGPGSYPITVRVTDNGSPNLYDEEIITVTVNEVATTLLNDGFEAAGNAWDDNWDENGGTSWIQSNTQKHGGSYSARSDSSHEGSIYSDDLNTSGATSVTVSFWFYHSNIDTDDLRLYFFDGSTTDTIASLGNTGSDNTWEYYTYTTTDTQYFRNDFYIRIRTNNMGYGDQVYIDDVLITKIP